MMDEAEKTPDMPEEENTQPRPPTVPRFYVNEAGHYLGSFDGLDEELPAMFIGAIEVPTAPQDAGQIWDFINSVWLPLPPVSYLLQVDNMWLNMTDTEADNFDTAMSTATPLRMRKAFNTASSMMSDSELFAFTKTVLKTVVTSARADEIMQNSSN